MDIETYNVAELAQTLFEECGDALLLFDPDTEQILDVNPMTQRLTGWPLGAFRRIPIGYLFRSEVPGGLQRLRQAYRKTGQFHSQEGFLLRHHDDGVWVPVNLTVTRLHAEPKTLGLITARDISERRRTQAALEKAEAELRQVFASVSDAVWSVQLESDSRWIPRYCSPVMERITGYHPERCQVSLRARLEILHEEDRVSFSRAITRLQQGQSDREELEYRIHRPDGALRWVRDSIVAQRSDSWHLPQLHGVLTDITERKIEERLLGTQRSLLELIACGAPLPDILDQLVRAIEEQSPGRFASLLVLEGDQLRLASAPNLPSPMRQALQALPLQEGPSSLLREPGRNCGLEGCWCQPILAPAQGPNDRATAPILGLLTIHLEGDQQLQPHERNLLRLVGHLAAIAIERHRSEEAIRASVTRYRALIENLEQCVFLKDASFRFVAVNPPFCRAVARAEEDIVGRSDFDFYPQELAEKFRNDDRAVLQGRRIEAEEASMVAGQRRVVRVVKTPLREEDGRIVGVLGIFWDVTEQRNLEAQLRQAQKMDAIGQLAGGVAHDFNNLLTAIMGNLSLLSGSIGLDPSAREMLQTAEAAAFRAANLTSQLLGFARRQILRTEPLSLNTLVDEVVALLKRTIDPRIRLVVQKEDTLWPVLADAGHINQVLMNLCLNARDAMPQGGELILQTQNVLLGPEQARAQLEARSGNFVCLRIRDTGAGMSEEVRSHLFEPFFTTKGPGKGTGLGLATVFGIIKQHQGWIECHSEPGQGTQFSIYLPRHHSGSESASTTEARAEGPRLQGTETILFVDDEPVLRNLGKSILQRYGYRVLLAEDGHDALEIYQRESRAIDLVILDLTMPRLSGRDTFRELRRLNPGLRVLFASGYSSEQLTTEEQEQIAGFVPKPYRPRELAAVIRETLDR